MTTKPKLKDFGCKAGGASTGLAKAGFDVVGVDIEPQPRYPYAFIQEDALTSSLDGFDAFWASPTCQEYSRASIQWRKKGKKYPDWLAQIRERLIASGKPYIIENVEGAPLINPTKLTASNFGLRIRRTRLFETSFEMPLILVKPTNHTNFRMCRPLRLDEEITPVGHFTGINLVKQITGFHWMNQEELAEAIPWQFSEFLGKYLLAEVMRNRQGGVG